MTLKAVLFDLGDTLIDLGEGRGSYEARVIARVNLVYDVLAQHVSLPPRAAFCAALAEDSEAQYHAALRQQLGISIQAVIARFLDQQGIAVSPAVAHAAAEAYCVGGAPVPSPLRTGALAVLKTLRGQGIRLGAISNTVQPAAFMWPNLAQRGIAEHLAVLLCSADMGIAKPHPEIFRRALAQLGVAAAEAAYVGDRLAPDVGGAQGAGMRGILIEVAHRVEQHPTITPDARITELPALPAALLRLFG